MATRPMLQKICVNFLQKRCRHSAPSISKPVRPRPWYRRVWEQATKMTFNEAELTQGQKCTRPQELSLGHQMETTVLPNERALANTIIKELHNARVLAIFQRLPIDERHMHLNRMDMQSKDLGTRIVTPRILKLVCQDSALENLNQNLVAGDLLIVWADNIDKCKTIAKYSKRLHWIIMLGAAIENRLMSASEFLWFVENQSNIEQFRAQFCGLLQSPVTSVSQSLDGQTTRLTQLLDGLERSEKELASN